MALVKDLKKVVIDTNIFLSALISLKKGNNDSPSLRILKQLESNAFLLMASGAILDEYRLKGEYKIKEGLILSEDFSKWMTIIIEKARCGRRYTQPPIHVITDPSDNIFFDNPNCLGADFLVTGNSTDMQSIQNDILALGLNLKIVKPHDYLMVTCRSYAKDFERKVN